MASKYLVLRRDGSVPEWPLFVLGASDPAAYAALVAYRREAGRRNYDAAFLAVLDERIAAFTAWTSKSVPDAVAFDAPAIVQPGPTAASKCEAHARNLIARLFGGDTLPALLSQSRRALGRS